MSKVIFGDILDIKEGIILHQVNMQGHMGGGIALQLANKHIGLLDQYIQYIENLKVAEGPGWKHRILGTVSFFNAGDDVIIGNCFSQYTSQIHGSLTSYDAIIKCFLNVREIFANDEIYIPFQYGCGIAGGNWKIVHEIAKDFNITVVARTSDYQNWLNK